MNKQNEHFVNHIPYKEKLLISETTLTHFFYKLNESIKYWKKEKSTILQMDDIMYATNDFYLTLDSFSSIHEKIRFSLEKKGCLYQKFVLTLNSNVYHILCCYPSEEKKNTEIETYFSECIMKIYFWLYIVQDHIKKNCSKISNITILFSDAKKYISDKKEILDTIHANSAFTTSCMRETNICIYRKEEWFKVFIHETFHCFGLDFSHIDNTEAESIIYKLFQVKDINGLRIFESYCESWALIMHSIIICFIQTQHLNVFLKKIVKILKKEIQFSAFQLAKILNYYKLTYEELINNSYTMIKFTEHTHILSYYIIKFILIFHMNEFESWSLKNNVTLLQFKDTKKNIQHYIKLIESLYKTPAFLDYIKSVENYLHNNTNVDLIYSMRMSFHEL